MERMWPTIEKVKEIAKKGAHELLPFWAKRIKSTSELKRRGFEKFDDFRVEQIVVDRISKVEKARPYLYGDIDTIVDKQISGTMVIDSYLLGDEPTEVEWFVEVRTSKAARVGKMEYSEHGNGYPKGYYPGGENCYLTYGLKKKGRGDVYWFGKDAGAPYFVQVRGHQLGLDDYPLYINGVYEFGKDAAGNRAYESIHRYREPYLKYFESLSNRVSAEIAVYIKKYALPELAAKENAIGKKFEVNPDASNNSQDRLDVELAESFSQGEIDGKYVYLLGGAEKFLEISKSEEYKLHGEEVGIIKENIAEIAGSLQREIYDLGCGDGSKARMIMEQQRKDGANPVYHPVDVSPHMVFEAAADASAEVETAGFIFDFTRDFKEKIQTAHNSFMLLGNTLGNGDGRYQENLLRNISEAMKGGDNVAVGVQLSYDFAAILKMYQTPESINFARPMLENLGIMAEDAEIFVSGDEEKREISLNIKILQDKEIKIGKTPVKLEAGKVISLIVSHKYEIPEMEKLSEAAKLKIKNKFLNADESYAVFLMEK